MSQKKKRITLSNKTIKVKIFILKESQLMSIVILTIKLLKYTNLRIISYISGNISISKSSTVNCERKAPSSDNSDSIITF